MNKHTQNKITKLSDRDHILQRASMYIGAVDDTKADMCILENNKFVFKEVLYNPGFMKIFNEIKDNSLDEAIRTNFEYANVINISYKDGMFSVEDNGRGVPQEDAYDGIPQAVVAFTEARAGGNFDDDNKANGIGMNGIGSYLTNVYSKLFIVETCDGKNKLTLTCNNNAESHSYTIEKASKRGTTVSFKPDLARFGMTEVSNVYFELIRNRCFHLAQSFPLIKFKIDFPTENNEKDSNEWI